MTLKNKNDDDNTNKTKIESKINRIKIVLKDKIDETDKIVMSTHTRGRPEQTQRESEPCALTSTGRMDSQGTKK